MVALNKGSRYLFSKHITTKNIKASTYKFTEFIFLLGGGVWNIVQNKKFSGKTKQAM
jgi:hypothetical protein